MYKKIVLSFVVPLFWLTHVWAWNAEITHKDLSEKAAENSILNDGKGDYLKNLGFSGNLDEKFTLSGINQNIIKWIRQGAYDEDAGSVLDGRFYNHFHDPTKVWSEAGLTSNWLWVKGGKSAVLWAVDDATNDMRWQKVRDSYYSALTSTSVSERSSNFARTFKGLGQIIHLVQDMAQPAHVKDLEAFHAV